MEFEITRGTPLSVTSTFTRYGKPQPIASCRVFVTAKINQTDPDNVAVAALDNQLLGGVLVLPVSSTPVGTPPFCNPDGNIAQWTMPASATYPLPPSVDRLCLEIWITQPGAIPWRAARGTVLLTGRAQVAQP
jgi:hypothetical protein